MGLITVSLRAKVIVCRVGGLVSVWLDGREKGVNRLLLSVGRIRVEGMECVEMREEDTSVTVFMVSSSLSLSVFFL